VDAGLLVKFYWKMLVNDLHMVQLMPVLPIISCFLKIQVGITFLVLAYPDCPGKEAVNPGVLSLLSFV